MKIRKTPKAERVALPRTHPAQLFLLALAALGMAGCASAPPAPVAERVLAAKKAAAKPRPAIRESDWRPSGYAVQKGDTLYSIALEHGLDYKELAEWNAIEPPYLIRAGQQLRLSSSYASAQTTALKAPPPPEARTLTESRLGGEGRPVGAEADKAPARTAATPDKSQPPEHGGSQTVGDAEEPIEWGWPASGKVVAGFNDGTSAKGIEITGKAGQPVFASAAGKVVYSGSGLRGYGKLIIIKHNKTYLSAYAHNSQILAREGQTVLKGQKIAEMGSSDADQVKLHFEIRRFGKPVDPAKYLSGEGTS